MTQPITVLGSGAGCDLILASGKVAAAHAAVVLLNDTAYLCDVGGGTSLNGRRIRWARLADGDSPSIGPFTFRVELQDGPHPGRLDHPRFSLRNDEAIGVVRSIDPILVVGRDPGCDVSIEADDVLPKHALVAWTQDGPFIRALQEGSRFAVNGAHSDLVPLGEGDVIDIGGVELVFNTGDTHPNRDARSDSRGARLSLGPTRQSAAAPSGNGRTKCGGRDHAGLEGALSMPLVTVGSRRTGISAPGMGRIATEEPVGATRSFAALEQRETDLKERVRAAQNALDERARKLWEGLRAERDRLAALQRELQSECKGLLHTVQEKHRQIRHDDELVGDADRSSGVASAVGECGQALRSGAENNYLDSAINSFGPNAEMMGLEVFSEPFRPRADTETNAAETDVAAALQSGSVPRSVDVQGDLTRHVRDFAVAMRGECVESDDMSSRLDALCSEVRRLQESMQSEAEDLSARMRELEARDASLRARMDETDRARRALDHEVRLQAGVHAEYEERFRELLRMLEVERRRLRVRKEGLQRKSAELTRTARQCRLNATPDAIEPMGEINGNGRLGDAAQTPPTASDVAQSAMIPRESGPAGGTDEVIDPSHHETDVPINEPASAVVDDQDEGRVEPDLTSEIDPAETTECADAAVDSGLGILDELNRDFESFRADNAAHEGPDAAQPPAPLTHLLNRRNQLRREQRWASILRAKLNEQIASLRGETASCRSEAEAAADPSRSPPAQRGE